jgi:L-2,4-diaminobutyrate decarboxylase
LNPIDTAYSPVQFAKLAEIWKQRLSEHLETVQKDQVSVLNWAEPACNTVAAANFMEISPQNGSIETRFESLVGHILSSGQNLQHPRYIGHQVPASVPIAALFDAVGSVTNQVMAIYEMGPWATAVECAIINALCDKIGWQSEIAGGLLTSGGSLANLTALLTARNIGLPGCWETGVPPEAIMVAHPDAHYSISRSAGILGLGTEQVVRAVIDDNRRIDQQQLDEQLQELKNANKIVVSVVACSCATPIGAFDNLNAIADVCQEHSIWLHVDAAHGGSALMSRQHRHKLSGIDRADSVVWDAHKMLFVPALCAAVLYKNREHRFETFRQDAPYLFDPSNPGLAEYDSGVATIECTKRALGFGLWGIWSLFGEELFEQLVDRTFERGHQLWQLVRDADDFEALHEPECNIVAFRHLPKSIANATEEIQNQFQFDLRTRLIQSGDFYIVQAKLNGQSALRACVMNPLTTEADLQELLNSLRRHATEMLAD